MFSPMSMEILVLLVLSLQTFLSANQLHVDLDFAARELRYKQGETRLTEFRSHSQLPQYGECWTKALTLLDAGCKHLTEDIQQRLAVEFSHCFLLKAGRPTEKCEVDQPVAVCTRRMQPEAFQAYSEFYTHTQNICFYLQAAVWQAETENTIERLADNSAAVAQQLDDASELQSELLRQQNVSLSNQQLLIVSGEELRRTIEDSKIDVRSMMTDLQQTTHEQRALIFEVFDRVRSLRSMVLGEFTGFYSLIFYFFAVIIAYLLTSTPRTSSSRFWLFVILTLNMTAEWLLIKWCNASEQLDPVTGYLVDENALVYGKIKSCRVCFVTLAIIIWSWMAFIYQDLNQINNVLLVDIKRQNAELKNLLQMSPRNIATVSTESSSCRVEKDDAAEQTTGYETFDETTDKDDARTRPVGHNKLPTVTGAQRITNIGYTFSNYLSSRRKPAPNVNADDELSASSSVETPTTPSTRRPRRRRNEIVQLHASGAGEANVSTPLLSTSRYNLRSRGNTPRSEPLYVIEPVSVNGQVEHLLNVTARNTMKTKHTVQHTLLMGSTDSDDD